MSSKSEGILYSAAATAVVALYLLARFQWGPCFEAPVSNGYAFPVILFIAFSAMAICYATDSLKASCIAFLACAVGVLFSLDWASMVPGQTTGHLLIAISVILSAIACFVASFLVYWYNEFTVPKWTACLSNVFIFIVGGLSIVSCAVDKVALDARFVLIFIYLVLVLVFGAMSEYLYGSIGKRSFNLEIGLFFQFIVAAFAFQGDSSGIVFALFGFWAVLDFADPNGDRKNHVFAIAKKYPDLFFVTGAMTLCIFALAGFAFAGIDAIELDWFRRVLLGVSIVNAIIIEIRILRNYAGR